MDENNSMELALSKLSLQENDVIVVKVDPTKWDVDKFVPLFNAIKEISPNPAIVIPDGVYLGTKNIDYMIQYLKDMKKN